MAAIQSLRTALAALGRNPVLFAGGLAYGLVVLPQRALSWAGVQSAALLLQIVTFFVTPLLVAGLIGMAAEAIDGDTGLGTFTRVGRERYVPLLIGKFVEFGINLLFGFLFVVAAIVAVVVVGVGFAGGSPAVGGGSLLLVVGLFAAVVLVALLVVFFIQFFPVAIVADGAGAIEGFKLSVSLVRSNLLATLGYSIINFLVVVATTLPVAGFALYRSFGGQFPPSPDTMPGAGAGGFPGAGGGMRAAFSTTEIVALAAVTLALTTLLTTFGRTYAMAFYRRHSASVEDRVLNESTP